MVLGPEFLRRVFEASRDLGGVKFLPGIRLQAEFDLLLHAGGRIIDDREACVDAAASLTQLDGGADRAIAGRREIDCFLHERLVEGSIAADDELHMDLGERLRPVGLLLPLDADEQRS